MKEYIHSTTTTPGMTDNQVSSSREPRRQHVTVINGPGWYGVQRVTCMCITVAGEGIKSFCLLCLLFTVILDLIL